MHSSIVAHQNFGLKLLSWLGSIIGYSGRFIKACANWLKNELICPYKTVLEKISSRIISCFHLKFKKNLSIFMHRKTKFRCTRFFYMHTKSLCSNKYRKHSVLTIVKDFNMLISKSHKLDKRTIFFFLTVSFGTVSPSKLENATVNTT